MAVSISSCVADADEEDDDEDAAAAAVDGDEDEETLMFPPKNTAGQNDRNELVKK